MRLRWKRWTPPCRMESRSLIVRGSCASVNGQIPRLTGCHGFIEHFGFRLAERTLAVARRRMAALRSQLHGLALDRRARRPHRRRFRFEPYGEGIAGGLPVAWRRAPARGGGIGERSTGSQANRPLSARRRDWCGPVGLAWRNQLSPDAGRRPADGVCRSQFCRGSSGCEPGLSAGASRSGARALPHRATAVRCWLCSLRHGYPNSSVGMESSA